MKILRHQKCKIFAREKYPMECGIAEVLEIMKTKLEMWDLNN